MTRPTEKQEVVDGLKYTLQVLLNGNWDDRTFSGVIRTIIGACKHLEKEMEEAENE